MNRKNKLPAILLCAGIAVGILLALYFVWTGRQASFIDGRPAEEMVYHADSPDGLHSLDVYKNGGKGATVADSAVIIISAHENGEKWKNKDQWCLYYSYRYANISAQWADDRTIIIQHHDGDEKELVLDIYQDEQ